MPVAYLWQWVNVHRWAHAVAQHCQNTAYHAGCPHKPPPMQVKWNDGSPPTHPPLWWNVAPSYPNAVPRDIGQESSVATRICLRPPDAMTSGDELQATVFIRHMVLHTLLHLPLLCPIVQGPLAIHSCHVINIDRASSLQCTTQLALQHMVGLIHGGHQDQPCPNQGKNIVRNGGDINRLASTGTPHPKVGSPVHCKSDKPLDPPIAVRNPSQYYRFQLLCNLLCTTTRHAEAVHGPRAHTRVEVHRAPRGARVGGRPPSRWTPLVAPRGTPHRPPRTQGRRMWLAGAPSASAPHGSGEPRAHGAGPCAWAPGPSAGAPSVPARSSTTSPPGCGSPGPAACVAPGQPGRPPGPALPDRWQEDLGNPGAPHTQWIPMGAQEHVLSPNHPGGNRQVSEKVEV